MFKLRVSVLVAVLALVPGWTTSAASSYRIVPTHTGFGDLFALAVGGSGNLFITDQKHFTILKLAPSGHLLLKIPMPKKCGISGLTVSPAGDIYAVANCQGAVYRFSPSGQLLQRFGRQPPSTNGVASDVQGHIYVVYGAPTGQPPPPPHGTRVRSFPNRFVEYSAAGRALRTVDLAGLHEPFGIAVDMHDNAYISATEGLVKVSAAGKVVQQWSQAAAGKFLPGQPVLDAQGNVYVPNGPGDILTISPSGRLLGAVIKRGAGQHRVQAPVGLAVDNAGHLFVADAGPNQIKEFSLLGKLLAVWMP